MCDNEADLYIYNNGTQFYTVCDMTDMIKKNQSLLELKSTRNDTFTYYSLIQGSYLKNPVEDLKLVLNEGLDIDKFNYYMCNWTQYSNTTKKAILTMLILWIVGHFSPLKDYNLMTDNGGTEDYRYCIDYNLQKQKRCVYIPMTLIIVNTETFTRRSAA